MGAPKLLNGLLRRPWQLQSEMHAPTPTAWVSAISMKRDPCAGRIANDGNSLVAHHEGVPLSSVYVPEGSTLASPSQFERTVVSLYKALSPSGHLRHNAGPPQALGEIVQGVGRQVQHIESSQQQGSDLGEATTQPGWIDSL
eukprot:scaffold1018_cov420-Prasinococcus_capsulatus_cf.AAC.8